MGKFAHEIQDFKDSWIKFMSHGKYITAIEAIVTDATLSEIKHMFEIPLNVRDSLVKFMTGSQLGDIAAELNDEYDGFIKKYLEDYALDMDPWVFINQQVTNHVENPIMTRSTDQFKLIKFTSNFTIQFNDNLCYEMMIEKILCRGSPLPVSISHVEYPMYKIYQSYGKFYSSNFVPATVCIAKEYQKLPLEVLLKINGTMKCIFKVRHEQMGDNYSFKMYSFIKTGIMFSDIKIMDRDDKDVTAECSLVYDGKITPIENTPGLPRIKTPCSRSYFISYNIYPMKIND